MVNLTDADIAEFKSIFRKETGKELSDDQARAYAENLIRLVAFVMKRPRPTVETDSSPL